MKSIFPLALLVALLAPAGAQTATSPIVGYTTQTIKSGQFNLIGLTLHEPAVAAGTLEVVGASSVTDTGAGFGTLLTAGKTYILEIVDTASPLNGIIQEIGAWSGDNLTTTQNLSVLGVAAGTKYSLRAAPTLNDLLGASNTAGFTGSATFNSNEADLVYVPNGTGGFDRYYYSTYVGYTGWYNATNNAAAGTTPVVYADGILIFRRTGADLSLVISGTVKTTVTKLALAAGQFNYISSVFPVGSTLGNSGMASNLTGSANFNSNEADLIYIPDGTGGYNRYYYSTYVGYTGWYNATTNIPSDTVPLSSGIIILRRGAAVNVVINPPSSYSAL
jgi:hypothetical protein